jgi:phosphoserine phosphatase
MLEKADEMVRREMKEGHTAGLVTRSAKPLKAIFFDMDSTVIGQESIVELSKAVGKQAEVDRITEEAMRGKLDFKVSLLTRLGVIAGVGKEVLDQAASTVTINPGMDIVAKTAKNLGIKLFLVSGGFNEIARHVASTIGFDKFHAHQLEFADGKITGQIVGDCVDGVEKARFMQQTMDEHGWSAEEVMVVGDGANDQAMLDIAGIAVGYHPKAVLIPSLDLADYSRDHGIYLELIDPLIRFV